MRFSGDCEVPGFWVFIPLAWGISYEYDLCSMFPQLLNQQLQDFVHRNPGLGWEYMEYIIYPTLGWLTRGQCKRVYLENHNTILGSSGLDHLDHYCSVITALIIWSHLCESCYGLL